MEEGLDGLMDFAGAGRARGSGYSKRAAYPSSSSQLPSFVFGIFLGNNFALFHF
jgi:hypothetical protein